MPSTTHDWEWFISAIKMVTGGWFKIIYYCDNHIKSDNYTLITLW